MTTRNVTDYSKTLPAPGDTVNVVGARPIIGGPITPIGKAMPAPGPLAGALPPVGGPYSPLPVGQGQTGQSGPSGAGPGQTGQVGPPDAPGFGQTPTAASTAPSAFPTLNVAPPTLAPPPTNLQRNIDAGMAMFGQHAPDIAAGIPAIAERVRNGIRDLVGAPGATPTGQHPLNPGAGPQDAVSALTAGWDSYIGGTRNRRRGG